MEDKLHVVIVGGGYAGANVAAGIGDDADVTLVSDQNFLLSTPMLAEVAAGFLDPRHIVTPLRDMCTNAEIVQGTVSEIDVKNTAVKVQGPMGVGERVITGDVLVLAPGSVTADFGVPGVAEHALPFKTVTNALVIRNRVLAALEGTAISDDPRLTRAVVVGAGYSGAELAAALSDLMHEAVETFFESAPRPEVTLVDAVDRVAPTLTERSSKVAEKQLRERRVEIRLNATVTAVDRSGVEFSDGTRIDAATVIWAAGVKPNPIVASLGFATEKGRLVTDGRMRVSDKVFALGDVAAVPDGSGEVSPPTAQFALRQARYLGENLTKIVRGEAVPRFKYNNRGQLVSLGHHNAVGRVLGLPVAGLPGWVLWRSYYLLQVPSLYRKMRIALDWTLDVVFPPDIAWIPSSSDNN